MSAGCRHDNKYEMSSAPLQLPHMRMFTLTVRDVREEDFGK